MSDRAKIADLLHEAGETHHVVYRIVDGDDPDWASWYADWLLNLSELPQLLGGAPRPRVHLQAPRGTLGELVRGAAADAVRQRVTQRYSPAR
jgi:hypothetical protein